MRYTIQQVIAAESLVRLLKETEMFHRAHELCMEIVGRYRMELFQTQDNPKAVEAMQRGWFAPDGKPDSDRVKRHALTDGRTEGLIFSPPLPPSIAEQPE
jgi:hypothetical protein